MGSNRAPFSQARGFVSDLHLLAGSCRVLLKLRTAPTAGPMATRATRFAVARFAFENL